MSEAIACGDCGTPLDFETGDCVSCAIDHLTIERDRLAARVAELEAALRDVMKWIRARPAIVGMPRPTRLTPEEMVIALDNVLANSGDAGGKGDDRG